VGGRRLALSRCNEWGRMRFGNSGPFFCRISPANSITAAISASGSHRFTLAE